MNVYVDPQQREYLKKRASLAALNHQRSSFGAWMARSASERPDGGQLAAGGYPTSSGGQDGRPDAKNGGV